MKRCKKTKTAVSKKQIVIFLILTIKLLQKYQLHNSTVLPYSLEQYYIYIVRKSIKIHDILKLSLHEFLMLIKNGTLTEILVTTFIDHTHDFVMTGALKIFELNCDL